MKNNTRILVVHDSKDVIEYCLSSTTYAPSCWYSIDLSKNDRIRKIETACHDLIETVNELTAKGRSYADKLKEKGIHLADLLFPKEIKNELSNYDNSYLILAIRTSLMQVPWELLCLDDQFLGKKFRMGRVISSKNYPVPVVNKNSEDKDEFRMWLISNPENNLDSATEECNEIKKYIERYHKNVKVYLDSNVSKSDVQERIKFYDFVHFAGHGIYSSKSGLDNAWSLTDNHTYKVSDIKSMSGGKSFPMFIFSNACQSARMSKWYFRPNNEQEASISSEFIFGGTNHCIGTMWDILDTPGSNFAVSFYKDLFAGFSIGKAIQNNFLPGYMLIGHPDVKYFGDKNLIDEKEQHSGNNKKEISDTITSIMKSRTIEEPVNTDKTDKPNKTGKTGITGIKKNNFWLLLFIAICCFNIVVFILGKNIINKIGDYLDHLEYIRIIKLIEHKKDSIFDLIKKYKNTVKGKCIIKEYSIAIDIEDNQLKGIQHIVSYGIQKQILESTCFTLLENDVDALKKIIENHIINELSPLSTPEKILYFYVQKLYFKNNYLLIMRLTDVKTGSIEFVSDEKEIHGQAKVMDQMKKVSTDFLIKLNEKLFQAEISEISKNKITINKGGLDGVQNGQEFFMINSSLSMEVIALQEHSCTLTIKSTEQERQTVKTGMILYRKCKKN